MGHILLRDLVLAELRASHCVVSAYSLTKSLSGDLGRRVAPNSVYRVLNELIAEREIQRVETVNGFISCDARFPNAVILVCQGCHSVWRQDGSELHNGIGRIAHGAAFEPSRQIIEMLGICASCANTAAAGVD